nr:MAG TPA: hypothetical protein [Bacteriophage sp.]
MAEFTRTNSRPDLFMVILWRAKSWGRVFDPNAQEEYSSPRQTETRLEGAKQKGDLQ